MSESISGYVRDAGGGVVIVVVDRDTMEYPSVGDHVQINCDRPIWRQVWRLLNDEFKPGDDTYKGVAKDIHNLYVDQGWTPPDITDEQLRAAAEQVYAGQRKRYVGRDGDPYT